MSYDSSDRFSNWQSGGVAQNSTAPAPVVSMFETKLAKGDLIGAINCSIAECIQVQAMAKQARADIDAKAAELYTIAEEALEKYPTL